jgi:sugar/nucleoside kinase (ribokinase family)
VPKEWPEKQPILSHLDILKTDAVEAEMLVGETNLYKAAQKIHDLGPREVEEAVGGIPVLLPMQPND